MNWEHRILLLHEHMCVQRSCLSCNLTTKRTRAKWLLRFCSRWSRLGLGQQHGVPTQPCLIDLKDFFLVLWRLRSALATLLLSLKWLVSKRPLSRMPKLEEGKFVQWIASSQTGEYKNKNQIHYYFSTNFNSTQGHFSNYHDFPDITFVYYSDQEMNEQKVILAASNTFKDMYKRKTSTPSLFSKWES